MIAPVGHVLDFAGLLNAPFGKRAVQTGGNLLRRRERHNPLRSLPPAHDMIPFRFKLGGFSDPQRLTHAYPPFDSQFGRSIREPEYLQECEQLTSISFARPNSSAQGPGSAPASRSTSPDTR